MPEPIRTPIQTIDSFYLFFINEISISTWIWCWSHFIHKYIYCYFLGQTLAELNLGLLSIHKADHNPGHPSEPTHPNQAWKKSEPTEKLLRELFEYSFTDV